MTRDALTELADAAVAWARADRIYTLAIEGLAPSDPPTLELEAASRVVDEADDRLFAAARALREQVDAPLAPLAPLAPPAVHVLFYGRPLCNFVSTFPGEWPEGHRWVGIANAHEATCSSCKTRAPQVLIKRRGGDDEGR